MKIVTGITLLLVSIWVLVAVETRVDVVKLANSAIEINSEMVNTDPILEGKLVSVTGVLTSVRGLGDGRFLQMGNYIAVQRTVEEFAWTEEKDAKANSGGVVYRKKWFADPVSSVKFILPKGHENPAKAIESALFKVSEAKIGRYEIDPSMIGMPQLSELKLDEPKVLPFKGQEQVNSKYIFAGFGSIGSPEIGDLRISYAVLPMGEKVTVFGKLSKTMIAPYLDQKNYRLYRMFLGNRQEALSSFPAEQKFSVWFFRILGFVLLWTGLSFLSNSFIEYLKTRRIIRS